MADPGFWILLIASAVVLLLAAIDVVWLICTRHAAASANPGAESGARTNQLCRSAGIGIGIEYVLDPVPTPGGQRPIPRRLGPPDRFHAEPVSGKPARLPGA
jgi:hypothetical protein